MSSARLPTGSTARPEELLGPATGCQAGSTNASCAAGAVSSRASATWARPNFVSRLPTGRSRRSASLRQVGQDGEDRLGPRRREQAVVPHPVEVTASIATARRGGRGRPRHGGDRPRGRQVDHPAPHRDQPVRRRLVAEETGCPLDRHVGVAEGVGVQREQRVHGVEVGEVVGWNVQHRQPCREVCAGLLVLATSSSSPHHVADRADRRGEAGVALVDDRSMKRRRAPGCARSWPRGSTGAAPPGGRRRATCGRAPATPRGRHTGQRADHVGTHRRDLVTPGSGVEQDRGHGGVATVDLARQQAGELAVGQRAGPPRPPRRGLVESGGRPAHLVQVAGPLHQGVLGTAAAIAAARPRALVGLRAGRVPPVGEAVGELRGHRREDAKPLPLGQPVDEVAHLARVLVLPQRPRWARTRRPSALIVAPVARLAALRRAELLEAPLRLLRRDHLSPRPARPAARGAAGCRGRPGPGVEVLQLPIVEEHDVEPVGEGLAGARPRCVVRRCLLTRPRFGGVGPGPIPRARSAGVSTRRRLRSRWRCSKAVSSARTSACSNVSSEWTPGSTRTWMSSSASRPPTMRASTIMTASSPMAAACGGDWGAGGA